MPAHAGMGTRMHRNAVAKKRIAKFTPKERVRRKWPDAYCKQGYRTYHVWIVVCGCWIPAASGKTPRIAWINAAKEV